MGKITGFMELNRINIDYDTPENRLTHYKEFTIPLNDTQLNQQAARCMDCGIPFCNNACPVNNIIPDWNDLVYHSSWEEALTVLHSTNNFPEFTGRVCPAPCEAACTLNIDNAPVGIKSIEQAIIDKGWENGWVKPHLPKHKTGKSIAIVGSGPAGLACAQQLARSGHTVTVFEKNDRIGGLLRYGIPDFKMEKHLIDRRVKQLQAEGVTFKLSTFIGDASIDSTITNLSKYTISPAQLQAEFDIVVLAGGAEQPRDLPVVGRELAGIHFAMEFLPQQNRVNAGDTVSKQIKATGKNVVVIGGGDTGSDCVGTSNRHGAASVVQIEMMPRPPEQENKQTTWPYWPYKLRTSSSHEEGCEREFALMTKRFEGGVGEDSGQVKAIVCAKLEWINGKMQEVPDSEFIIPADLVLFAMGFVSPAQAILNAFNVAQDERGNAKTGHQTTPYLTNVPNVFACGDMRRGQSLVVWAIQEGRQCANAINEYLIHQA
jgi:glutamate synthase (NADPH) small chain